MDYPKVYFPASEYNYVSCQSEHEIYIVWACWPLGPEPALILGVVLMGAEFRKCFPSLQAFLFPPDFIAFLPTLILVFPLCKRVLFGSSACLPCGGHCQLGWTSPFTQEQQGRIRSIEEALPRWTLPLSPCYKVPINGGEILYPLKNALATRWC